MNTGMATIHKQTASKAGQKSPMQYAMAMATHARKMIKPVAWSLLTVAFHFLYLVVRNKVKS